jgi:hypothetical protein
LSFLAEKNMLNFKQKKMLKVLFFPFVEVEKKKMTKKRKENKIASEVQQTQKPLENFTWLPEDNKNHLTRGKVSGYKQS